MIEIQSFPSVELEEMIDESINSCYQCKKCTLGCPVALFMEIQPHQIIRLLQYGLEERIYESESLWICANCETCGVRCPNGINIGVIMDSLRQWGREKGLKRGTRDIPIFHSNYIECIERRGRIHEISMLMKYKLKTKNIFEDLFLGWDLFSRGKLPLRGHSIEGKEELQRIFSTSNL